LTIEWSYSKISEMEGDRMREKVILVCTECLSRNYTTSKKKAVSTKRMEMSKFCPKCNKHTVHKESR